MTDSTTSATIIDQVKDAARKTFKRETGWAAGIITVFFYAWAAAYDNEMAFKAAEALTLPTLALLGGALGLDSWAKQIRR